MNERRPKPRHITVRLLKPDKRRIFNDLEEETEAKSGGRVGWEESGMRSE